MTDVSKAARIRVLNDTFRQTFLGGKVMYTLGVGSCSEKELAEIVRRVRVFSSFETDNDPYREHGFGSFELGGKTLFWKIDYYDLSLEHGSEDPADAAQTIRVLTIMLANEH